MPKHSREGRKLPSLGCRFVVCFEPRVKVLFAETGEKPMILLDFNMFPTDKGESVSPFVARCLGIVAASGLDYHLHSMGTTLEGEWKQVARVVGQCLEALARDCNRISCSIRIDYRKGSESRLESKVQKVEALLGTAGIGVTHGGGGRPTR
jgi:uncharacterized protein (TIGR00106 family)